MAKAVGLNSQYYEMTFGGRKHLWTLRQNKTVQSQNGVKGHVALWPHLLRFNRHPNRKSMLMVGHGCAKRLKGGHSMLRGRRCENRHVGRGVSQHFQTIGEMTLTLFWRRTVQRIRSWCQTAELSPEINSFGPGVSSPTLFVSAPQVAAPLLSHDGWLFCGASGHPRGRRVFPVGPSDADVAYPLLSCLACHAFLRFVLGFWVWLCLCGRFVPSFFAVFSVHHVTCGRVSPLDEAVRTPCRQ